MYKKALRGFLPQGIFSELDAQDYSLSP